MTAMWKNDEFPARDAFDEFWNEAMLCGSGDVEELALYKHTLNEIISYLDEHLDFKSHGGDMTFLCDSVANALCEIIIMGRIGEVENKDAWEDFVALCIKNVMSSEKVDPPHA